MKPELEFSRRSFVRAAGVVPAALAQPAPALVSSSLSRRLEGKTQLSVTSDGVIHAETPTLVAKLEKGWLTSLKSKSSSEEYITGFDASKIDALQLVYGRGETVDVGEQKFGKVESRQVSDLRVEVIFQNWDGDGVISVSVDPGSGQPRFEATYRDLAARFPGKVASRIGFDAVHLIAVAGRHRAP